MFCRRDSEFMSVLFFVFLVLLEMNTRRTPDRRVEENDMNEEIPPPVEQVPQGDKGAQGSRDAEVPIVGDGNDVPVVPPEMTSGEIREAFLILDRALTTHVNRGIEHRGNVVERSMTSRLIDFMRMNPPIFLGSMVGEDP